MRLPWRKPSSNSPSAFQAALPALLPPPTPEEQQHALNAMRLALQPLLGAERLDVGFVLQPGLRLSRSYGNCRFRPGEAPVISIRCTSEAAVWRTRSAIMLTLLHEVAHLKYRGHGQRFWALHRRLVILATERGLYHPADDDATEPAQGNGKLAGSPAAERAEAAQQARRQRTIQARAATRTWRPGDRAMVTASRGPLAGQHVSVVKVGRTRVVAALSDGRRYSIPGSLLARLEAE